jgi:predicted acylesterase/phospholipase RssA
MTDKKTKIRIILSGGGVRGAYQVGVLSSIMNSGKYEIDKVYGCSVGAIQSPLVAMGATDRLINFYKGLKTIDDVVERRSIFGIKLPDWDIIKYFSVLFKMGAYKRIKVDEMVAANLTKEELDAVKDKCHVVAFNVTNNTETWFTGDKLLEGIKCSVALWYVVPPYKYHDDYYVDGGACEVFPLNYILNKEYETGEIDTFDGLYIFVDLDTRQYYTRTAPTNILGLMSNIHVSALCKVAELEENKLKRLLGDRLVIIRPDDNTTVLRDTFDLDQTRIMQTIELGKRDGHRFLRTNNDVDDGVDFNQIEYKKKLDVE